MHPVKIIVSKLLKLLMSRTPDNADPLRLTVVIPVLVKLIPLQLPALAVQFSNVIPAKLVQPEKFMFAAACKAEKTIVPFNPVQPWKFRFPFEVVSTGKEGAPVSLVQPWKLIPEKPP